MRLGILLASIGEADRYRDLCRQLLDQYAGTSDIYEADETLKTCCLLGRARSAKRPSSARLADVAVSGDPTQRWSEWLLLASGLQKYRAGRFDAAVTTCRASRPRGNSGSGDVDALAVTTISIEAMALERSGDAAGARGLLAEAKKLIDEKLVVLSGGELGEWWHDRLAAQLLYREAKSLLERDKNGPKKRGM